MTIDNWINLAFVISGIIGIYGTIKINEKSKSKEIEKDLQSQKLCIELLKAEVLFIKETINKLPTELNDRLDDIKKSISELFKKFDNHIIFHTQKKD